MSYYNTINNAYVNQKSLYMYDNYNDSIITYELLLKIIRYNDNDDTKFDIFYKKHMTNFKLNQKYYNEGILFDTFNNANDFIKKLCSPYINNENFYKEIRLFIIRFKETSKKSLYLL